MDFRIADTFTESLAKLTENERKAAKMAAFDLQVNPSHPSFSFHRVDRSKDKNFWTARVNSDLRMVAHRTEGSLLLCFVGHHDKAYEWAERRKLETHPMTGAAQLVEIRETVKEVFVPVYVDQVTPVPTAPVSRSKPPRALFASTPEAELLSYGVPPEWLAEVKKATEDSLLRVSDYLPSEAAEALLELATGGKPRQPVAQKPANPFDHPDAQRRFRTMANADALAAAMDFPWDKWIVFLHPDQRETVEKNYSGPARVSGSAGTGKTIVALHRAVHLARGYADGRVLLTTYSEALANALHGRLKRLLGSEPRLGERIDVHSLLGAGIRLHKAHVGSANLVDGETVRQLIEQAATGEHGGKFSLSFLMSEWSHVVDAWNLRTWDEYRDVARLGRRTRLLEAKRKDLWAIFEQVQAALAAQGRLTESGLFHALAVALVDSKHPPFEFVVVDEAQDLSVAHLRFLAAIGAERENGLFFAGDLGQRIFQQPFSWKVLGVDVRGRSSTLRVNYRTSHQIRTQADLLLNPKFTDVDGNEEKRNDTVSVFNGPVPTFEIFASEKLEQEGVAKWVVGLTDSGVAAHEIGVFVRSSAQIKRAVRALELAALPHKVLDDQVQTVSGHASIGTMHLAKGLEFRGVVVMACDDEIIPLQDRIEAVGDAGDLQEVYDTERQLLYVACTRARERLLVTSVEPSSEFLDDLRAQHT